MTDLSVVPCTFAEAKAFVAAWHRHHKAPAGGKFTLGVSDGDKLVGVAVTGRPGNRISDDGLTLEVTRVATDGTPNACSVLYAACWRAAKAMGYHATITYTLESEGGASLRAAGWRQVHQSMPRVRAGRELRNWAPSDNDAVTKTMWAMGDSPETRNGRVTGRVCGGCGRKFTPARSDTRYCSAACRQRAYRVRISRS